jgi:hypothetical protein
MKQVETSRPQIPFPTVIYFATKTGCGLPHEAEWHQLQILRIAEEARQAVLARGPAPGSADPEGRYR